MAENEQPVRYDNKGQPVHKYGERGAKVFTKEVQVEIAKGGCTASGGTTDRKLPQGGSVLGKPSSQSSQTGQQGSQGTQGKQ